MENLKLSSSLTQILLDLSILTKCRSSYEFGHGRLEIIRTKTFLNRRGPTTPGRLITCRAGFRKELVSLRVQMRAETFNAIHQIASGFREASGLAKIGLTNSP